MALAIVTALLAWVAPFTGIYEGDRLIGVAFLLPSFMACWCWAVVLFVLYRRNGANLIAILLNASYALMNVVAIVALPFGG